MSLSPKAIEDALLAEVREQDWRAALESLRVMLADDPEHCKAILRDICRTIHSYRLLAEVMGDAASAPAPDRTQAEVTDALRRAAKRVAA